MANIPFYRPYVSGRELKYIQAVIETAHLAGGGVYTRKCQELLTEALDGTRVLLTTSCTHALEMAALLLEVERGDEVILPSFTFVSTANAFVLRGARPVFIDIRPDTLNLDESLLEDLITAKTKAVVPVHYAGVACEMDAVMRIAKRHGIEVVEDNAHGLFGRYKSKLLGTFGCLGALSFHDTKNFSCGEGGALLINDIRYLERAEIIWEKGTDRCRFFRGEVDKYSWVDIGSSYLPSDLLAACLYAQFELREEIQARRRRSWEFYLENLQPWAHTRGVKLPSVPEDCLPAYHLFYLILPSKRDRQEFICFLREAGISSVFHYVPLHSSKMGRRFGHQDCPVTEDFSARLVRLPFFSNLTREQQERVVEVVTRF